MESEEPRSPDTETLASYEKEIFDLRQLLEISKSLNSTLELKQLLESILYTCMAQVKVLQVAAFIRTELEVADLQLHRNVIGFDIEPGNQVIAESSALLMLFRSDYRVYTMEEIERRLPEEPEVAILSRFSPTLLVPIRARTLINGVILLGERIPTEPPEYSEKERSFLLDVALLAGIAVHNAFLFEVTNTDLMTRLKMRHYFLTMLSEAIQRTQGVEEPLSLIMLDLDHFKRVNDSYGHLFGDEVLRRVAELLIENVRQTDLAARYGGEEFIVLLPNTVEPKALEIAERVRKAVEAEEFRQEGGEVAMTVSLGVATYDPAVDGSRESFIDRADQALYRSKREGRNRTTPAAPR